MAKQQQNGQTQMSTNRFDNSVNTDIRDYHLDPSSWTFARNAINNSHVGDLGSIGNEPSNQFCSNAPYVIIGVVHRVGTLWTIYSTNNIDSEIGVFDESNCTYIRKINDRCLGFKTYALIKGACRPAFDCDYRDYWADGLNPDRTVNVDNPPYVQDCTDSNKDDPGGCIECVDTDELDCDKLRLESFIQMPYAKISKGSSGGTIFNGSYYVVLAYAINKQIVTDYFTMSNILSVFDHENLNSTLEIEIDNLDKNFDDYELVIVATVNEKTYAKRLGLYSTNQNIVTIDYLDPALPSIPLENLAITNPISEKSEAIYNSDKYLFRVAPTSKLDFNYQPIANQIITKWQSVEYKKEYYKNAGTNVGYMRDENYAFFIRWIYTTGDKSPSFHIPGRGPRVYSTFGLENSDYTAGTNDIETADGLTPKVFEVINTASITSYPGTILDDGGVVIAEGDMGYHESSEFYDDKHPEVWNSNIGGRPDLDLCGMPIRHHKFPENVLQGSSLAFTNHYNNGGDKIRIMGVRFENILPPKDNQGNVISNVVGYEILRSSRNGNKTVMYKGIINNMFTYDINDAVSFKTGLYPNYPYNDLRPDPFISKTETHWETIGGYEDINPIDTYSKKHFTFHSPDTMFYRPFLLHNEFKIYGEVYGDTIGSYVHVDNHPKHKFVTDVTFACAVVAGIGYAITQTVGELDVSYQSPEYYEYDLVAGVTNTIPLGAAGAGIIAAMEATTIASDVLDQLAKLADTIVGTNLSDINNETLQAANNALNIVPGTGITTHGVDRIFRNKNQSPLILRIAQGVQLFAANLMEGSDITINLIRASAPYRQFATQFQSHCGYENFGLPSSTNRRHRINKAKYLESHIQDYDTSYLVNNMKRNKTVIFDTVADIDNTIILDNSRVRPISQEPSLGTDFTLDIKRNACSHYGAFKNRLRNQYNKVESITQLPVSNKVFDVNTTLTTTLFGGDTYIGRYQEKNTFYYFYKWLLGEPNGEEFNYHLYDMVRYVTYWMDTEPFDTAEFVNSIGTAISTAINGGGAASFFSSLVTPSDKHCLDRRSGGNGFFTLKNVFMYLFNSGVRDFFVESELNIDYRDYEDSEKMKHWDVMQDRKTMFHSRNIEAGNFYKLDKSLHVNQLPYSKISWSQSHQNDYSPLLAETCFTKYPRRVLYSLPQQNSLKKDNWSVFLANNYKDFNSKVTGIKSINGTALIMMFENHAPGLFPGVDELQLRSGTSITVGDGGLFTREMQQLSNSESSLEYGSCQSSYSIIHTPHGLFYMSVQQGKVFQYAGGLKELSLKDNQYWFNQYLPYQLTIDFPEYDLLDNPVVGIGCQTIYDAEWGLVYFCKKDYRLKPEFINRVTYKGNGEFVVDRITTIKTGDPMFFDNASWTVSYDPKEEGEVSWHDWHPDLSFSGKNTFLVTKRRGIWRHNDRCDSYGNFFGKQYPFHIEYQIDNLPAVITIKNIEYFMQVFKYDSNCKDRFHVLDFNFDEAVIYNSEQCSGVLKLNLQPKNNVFEISKYPIVSLNKIDILYTKEEQKYRFNQFWDITKNRGEFNPTVQEMIWNTEPNGYVKVLNPNNLNYQKSEFERKKIRHNNNRVLLICNNAGDKKIIMLVANTKLIPSSR